MRKHTEEIPVPKARADDLLIERVDDETVVYDLKTKEVHCLGALATAVFDLCDGQTSSATIADVATERVGWPVSGDDVAMALAQLEERDLLSRPVLRVVNGLSRREVMRKSAIFGGTVAAASLITSIVAPTAMAVDSGIPAGCTGCGANKDCASGHCCQSNAGKDCLQTCCVGGNNSCHFATNSSGGLVCTVTATDIGVPCPDPEECPGSSTSCCTP